MTYGIGIGFPAEPNEKDIKKIKWETQIKQNPPVKRIEVHGGHQRLVVRDLKTGQYVNKR